MTLSCTSGLISIDALSEKTGETIFSAGIIPKDSKVNTYCSNSAFYDPVNCSSLIDREALQTTLMEHCIGKQKCLIEDINQLVDKSNTANKMLRRECFSNESFVFIQVGCMVPDFDLATRKELALGIGCSAVFVALFVINYLDYIKQS